MTLCMRNRGHRAAAEWFGLLYLIQLLCVPWVHAQDEDALPVTVVTPTAVIPTQELRLSGTLVAEQRALLSARVDGLVARVLVDAGQRVQAGDLLLELDPALEQHALRQMEAATAAARASLAENERLVTEAERLTRDNHLPQTELALRQAALALARAGLDGAKAEEAGQREQVERHRLPAPFSGVISRKLAEAGEWVARGTAVLELVATDRLRLDVQAPQERFAALSADTRVAIFPDSLPGEMVPGRILALVPVSDAGSRTFQVRVVMEDEGQRLLPGTSATAVFDLSQGSRSALMVPRDALLRSPDGSLSLFAVQQQNGQFTAHRRQVVIGHQSVSDVEILQGLQADEQVVVRGNEILRDNQPVRVLQNR